MELFNANEQRALRRNGESSASHESHVATPQFPRSLGSTKTIELGSGAQLSLTVAADLFAISAEDRKFVLALVEMLESYEAKRNS
jgi:hypothetical protein